MERSPTREIYSSKIPLSKLGSQINVLMMQLNIFIKKKTKPNPNKEEIIKIRPKINKIETTQRINKSKSCVLKEDKQIFGSANQRKKERAKMNRI